MEAKGERSRQNEGNNNCFQKRDKPLQQSKMSALRGKFRSIKSKIIALLLLAVLILVASGAFVFYRARCIQEKNLFHALEKSAITNAKLVETELMIEVRSLHAISQSPILQEEDITIPLAHLDSLLAEKKKKGSHIISFGLINLEGYLREAADPEHITYRGNDACFKGVRDGAPLVFTAPGYSKAFPGIMRVAVAIPVFKNDQLYRVLRARLSLYHLSGFVEKIKFGEKGRAFIVDEHGIIIAHHREELLLQDFTKKSDLISAEKAAYGRQIIQERSGQVEYTFRDISSIISFKPVPLTDWIVLTVAERGEFFAPLRTLTRTIAILITGPIILLLLLGFYIANKITRPLQSLSDAAAKLSQGDMDTEIVVKTGDEVGCLAEVFEKMRCRMKEMIRSSAVSSANDIIGWMMDTRDPYTAGHQQRVAKISYAIAKEIGLSDKQAQGVYMSATLHDIGKIIVPIELLNKPGKLSEIEMEMIRTHAQAGYDALKTIEFYWPVVQIVLQHHERLDGSGYPQGLIGKDILVEAKILAVADVVEAMSSNRPYRPAIGVDKTLAEILQHRGVLYDHEAVDACIRLFSAQRIIL